MALLVLFGPAIVLKACIRRRPDAHIDILLGAIFWIMGWALAGMLALIHIPV